MTKKSKQFSAQSGRTASGQPAEALASGETLRSFLLSLPATELGRIGYNKGELQLRLPKALSDQLKSLSESLSVTAPEVGSSSSPSVQRSGSDSFRVDTLAAYLLTEFLDTNQSGVDSLIAGFVAARDQANTETSNRRNSIFDAFEKENRSSLVSDD